MGSENATTPLAWNRVHRLSQRVVEAPREVRDLVTLSDAHGTLLPRGYGHSYGDSCLNGGNTLLDMTNQNRVLSFDTESGLIKCESGVTIGMIQRLAAPYGWRLAVTPSTRHVSVGGAVAHDVHGRNHPAAGSFGQYVREIELLRTDGSRRLCSPTDNKALFRATVGGMGLTGLIASVEIQLRRIESSLIDAETIAFSSLSRFIELVASSIGSHEYATAWIDLANKRTFRGILDCGNEASPTPGRAAATPGPSNSGLPILNVPFECPQWLVNEMSVRAFNKAYLFRSKRQRPGQIGYEKFFYQLDAVSRWNRLLGRNGFYQYHFVIPSRNVPVGLPLLVDMIHRSGNIPFLAILKRYGTNTFPGMMSFPTEGLGGAIDFVNKGQQTLRLFHELDKAMLELGGKVYLAKDSALTPEVFKVMYPRWREFSELVDPHFSSSLWRRVTGDTAKSTSPRRL
ncbi:FAD-binding oxidoreductase [Streptomyces sp. SID13031]|uniref:FAD-binding oxidoreductase n=1 Tax=Streptomyces sp. SID13031 TaxID=2706046 RepID=UPI0013C8A8F6|nr:FAD-binding oxidoreductase [Streptomyces sp. SID13031]NEA36861.1 FAD-binding oxidoreductase [Streptomyces sp. SID13031]